MAAWPGFRGVVVAGVVFALVGIGLPAQAVSPSPEPDPVVAASSEPTVDPSPSASPAPSVSPEPSPAPSVSAAPVVPVEPSTDESYATRPTEVIPAAVDDLPLYDGGDTARPAADVFVDEVASEAQRQAELGLMGSPVPSSGVYLDERSPFEDQLALVSEAPASGVITPVEGGGDVHLTDASTADAGDSVQVQVIAPDQVDNLPGAVAALRVHSLEVDARSAQWSKISIDYADFKDFFGSNFTDQMTLMMFPDCALTTPNVAGCLEGVPLETTFTRDADVVSAYVPVDPAGILGSGAVGTGALSRRFGGGGLPQTSGDLLANIVGMDTGLTGQGTFVAAVGTPGGQAADFSVTKPAGGGSWGQSGSTGAFTYSLPFDVPANPNGGSTPSVALSYNSQAVDGMTLAANGQASDEGLGWSLNESYIERRYVPCSEDGSTGSDLCWRSPWSGQPGEAAMTMVLDGASFELINTGPGTYRAANQPAWRITRQVVSASYPANGDNDREFWQVDFGDGSRYFFGRGSTFTTDRVTNSVLTVPVWGNNSGEPCYGTSTPCTQGYRWMLDQALDPHSNVENYFYFLVTNSYRGHDGVTRSYRMGSTLTSVEYGERWQSATVNPPARVTFAWDFRCTNKVVGDPWTQTTSDCPSATGSPSSWPDTPGYLLCSAATCPSNLSSPSFFSVRKLSQVTTQLETTAGLYVDVETTKFGYTFPQPADGTSPDLTLTAVQTKYFGHPYASGEYLAPAVRMHHVFMHNRVDYTTSVPTFDKVRVDQVHNPLGGSIYADYGVPASACPTKGVNGAGWSSFWSAINGNWDHNDRLCWNVWHDPDGDGALAPTYGIFHRYVVTQVTEQDRVAGSPAQVTNYTYEGDPAWAYQDDPEWAWGTHNQTWNQWRGFGIVKTSTGSGVTATSTRTQYYRGMNGDRNADGTTVKSVSITDIALSTSITDYAELVGQPVASVTSNSTGHAVSARLDGRATVKLKDGPGFNDATYVASDIARTVNYLNPGVDNGSPEYGRTVSYYDSGNRLTKTLDYGVVPNVGSTSPSGENSCTQYTYATDARANNNARVAIDDPGTWNSAWYAIDSVASTRSYDSVNCTGNVTEAQDRLYMGSTDMAANYGTRGDLTEVRTFTTATAAAPSVPLAPLTEQYSYDTYGRVLTAKTPAQVAAGAVGTTIAYGAYTAVSPFESVTVTVKPSASATAQVSTTWNEPAYGNVLATQSAAGVFTRAEYDSAGRLTAVYQPDQLDASGNIRTANPVPTLKASYPAAALDAATVIAPSWVTTQTLTKETGAGTGSDPFVGTYVIQTELFDGFARSRETHSTPVSNDGGSLVSETLYDSDGRVQFTTAPFWAETRDPAVPTLAGTPVAGLPSYTKTTYDFAGRTISTALMDHTTSVSATSTTYSGRTVTVATPDGVSTVTTTDPQGRTTKVEESSGGVKLRTTDYAYVRAAGTSTVAVTDAASNASTFVSDLAGRQVLMKDPNAGDTKYTLDPDGRVLESESKAGFVDTVYDAMGRPTQRTTRVSASDPVQNTTAWTYDALGGLSALGQLLKTVSTTGTDVYTTQVTGLDGLKRPTQTTVTLPDLPGLGEFSKKPYTTSTTYDSLGRAYQAGLPAVAASPAETLTTGFTDRGAINSLTSSDATVGTILSSVTRRVDGRVSTRSLANSVTRTLQWDDTKRVPTVVQATIPGVPNAIPVQQDAYTYDGAGRVTAITDAVQHLAQCYHYDGLNRLDSAWTQAAPTSPAACATTAPTDTSWNVPDKPSSYFTDWEYGAAGQILTQAAKTAAATTAADTHYSYTDPLDPLHPNAVKSTSGSVAGSYKYDAAGRMIARPGQTITWDVLSNLTSVDPDLAGAPTTQYLYDPSGQRYAAITGDTATLYQGSWDATDPNTKDNSSADVKVTRYYSADGAQLASKTTSESLLVTLGDVQGSAQVTVDPTGAKSTNSYTPYGMKRAGSAVASAHGWLNQVADDTGLTYLNARYYDPVLGRFLSPDPLINSGDPRTLDPYRYADNNPASFTDESGLAPSCARLTGKAMNSCASYAGGSKNYITGELDPWKAEHPRDQYSYTSIPKARGTGVVTVGAFIETEIAGVRNTFGLFNSRGDNRGFDAGRTWSDSRFSAVADFENGTLRTHVGSSCHDAGRTQCAVAEAGGVSTTVVPFDRSKSHQALACGGTSYCYTDPRWPTGSVVDIEFAKGNPAVLWAPELNLSITIGAAPNGKALVSVQGDVYPSIEAYRVAGSAPAQTLIQSHAVFERLPESAGALQLGQASRGVSVG